MMDPTRWQIRNNLMPSSSLCPTTVTWVGFTLSAHCCLCTGEKERTRGGATSRLTLYPNMADTTTGASNCQNASVWLSENILVSPSFAVEYFWLSLCVTHKGLNMTPPYFKILSHIKVGGHIKNDMDSLDAKQINPPTMTLSSNYPPPSYRNEALENVSQP